MRGCDSRLFRLERGMPCAAPDFAVLCATVCVCVPTSHIAAGLVSLGLLPSRFPA